MGTHEFSVAAFAPIAVLLLSIPAASQSEESDTVTRAVRRAEPPLGVETEVTTGDVMLVQFERSEIEFAKLKHDVRVSKSGMVLPKGLLLEASIEVGTGRKEYCKGYEAAFYCLQDRNNDGSFEKAQILGGGRPAPNFSARYELEYKPAAELSGWRKELLYQGAAAGVLRITFREFGNDWSIPKTSQDLTYDLVAGDSTEVVYQGARLQILSAASNGARYKVVSGFRDPSAPP